MHRLKLVIACIGALSGGAASASEGGGTHDPLGTEGFLAGVLPPPGTYWLNYLQYYHAGRVNDRDGNKLRDVNIDVIANVFRFVNVTPIRIFGGGYWAQHVVIPLVSIDRSSATAHYHTTGIGDITLNPLIFGWHLSDQLHVVTGFNVVLPSGSYTPGQAVNTGRNHYTFTPILSVTYRIDKHLEVSGKFRYSINTENPDTRFTSGDEFVVDFALGYQLNSKLQLGSTGFYQKQVTQDRGIGSLGMVETLAAGPSLRYSANGLNITATYQHEFIAKATAQGERFFIKSIARF